MSFPLPGQRWTSASQPELGLGLIITAEGDRVEICFPAAEEVRQYVFSSAPLIRVHFKEGDKIKNQAGQEFTVEAVEERDGLLVYLCGEEEIRGRTSVRRAELYQTRGASSCWAV